jgi:hypothetical protein
MDISPNFAFLTLNTLALIFWVLLIFFYQSRIYRLLISSGFAFIFLGLVYFLLFVTNLDFDPSVFGSLEGMKSLYSNPWLILLGWVHYLAFDLLAGVWIRKDSKNQGIPEFLIIISLVFTFMTGPFGFLLYLSTKAFYQRSTAVH